MVARDESYNPLLKSYPDSEKVNACSFGAETFYTRLVARSDDLARYWADPPMVLGKLFTHRFAKGEVDATLISVWLTELAKVGLIVVYEVGGRRYLQMVNCRKALRKDVRLKSTFPGPEDGQLLVYDPVTDTLRTRAVDGPDAGRARFSPPTTPPINPTPTPSDVCAGAREGPEGEDGLDGEIRRYLGEHPGVMWDPKTHSKCRKLVEGAGWPRAKQLIDQGVARRNPFPVGWALSVWAGEDAKTKPVDEIGQKIAKLRARSA